MHAQFRRLLESLFRLFMYVVFRFEACSISPLATPFFFSLLSFTQLEREPATAHPTMFLNVVIMVHTPCDSESYVWVGQDMEVGRIVRPGMEKTPIALPLLPPPLPANGWGARRGYQPLLLFVDEMAMLLTTESG